MGVPGYTFGYEPDIASWANQRLDIFVIDTAHSVQHAWVMNANTGSQSVNWEHWGPASGMWFQGRSGVMSLGDHQLSMVFEDVYGNLQGNTYNWGPSNTWLEEYSGAYAQPGYASY
jgi:hypothetical protein